jgi:low temperature requirement protein LtrA
MWLPTPIYERTPQLWLLMAALFLVLALYIGFAYKFTAFYLALGAICAVRGIQIISMRRKHRGGVGTAAALCDEQAAEAAGR